jgi:putative heme-binding domain-containing protein
MPPTKLSEDDTWRLVAFVKSLTGPAAENNVPGDVEAGRAIFWGSAAGCSGCHSIRGKGGLMGPDLSDVGGSRPLPAIREAILEPSKDLFTFGQEGVTVTLRNGKKIEGVARNRNNYSLQVVDRAGNLHLIPMLDVTVLELSSRSPMPGDYGKRLSRTDLQNLLAYLARQTVRPAGPAPGEPTR